ncbi:MULTISPECIES: B3/B4 domain-containing protein [Prauserella salsuginis group]|uniref:B3/4 domain-containing protein n=1 Tax=Prauserella salsuginis TaxID=387889 RepID=A0ABW6GAV8_9PSEU|nr:MULTISPECIES: phenylalanine--tRNA ligase beta subunit-related protein [Prauserella salsuginis group]MCR3722396.1 B3/B4 domain-containing protein (DNA/RNA-binding domain of Phe-tRNA-synthetase) [Prauserella flava]MCR3736838.1 B3/B4 domain-containing protein (DNA/RNA-binding domain of Phe-tRNA-synthetase) [Prauserella salsuginis]
MPDLVTPDDFLAACTVEPEVFELRPDYRAALLVVDGLAPDNSDGAVDAADELIASAEAHARTLLASTPVDELPHIAAWREAYRAFGAKPQRTRNSLEALTRRAEKGLPRVNALTDVYNAVSVLRQIPLGGEDFHAYDGPARLTRATGDEPFDTAAGGETVLEHPQPGEVVWCDGSGVTCRRWNWRQGRRTGLTDATTTALFILDALAPMTDEELTSAADDLADAVGMLGDRVTVTRRLIGAAPEVTPPKETPVNETPANENPAKETV